MRAIPKRTPEQIAEALEAARTARFAPLYRSEWLNLHLGGFHWAHNDLADWNLKAVHSCPVCRAFRDRSLAAANRIDGLRGGRVLSAALPGS